VRATTPSESKGNPIFLNRQTGDKHRKQRQTE
jgi:hypothetical protein